MRERQKPRKVHTKRLLRVDADSLDVQNLFENGYAKLDNAIKYQHGGGSCTSCVQQHIKCSRKLPCYACVKSKKRATCPRRIQG